MNPSRLRRSTAALLALLSALALAAGGLATARAAESELSTTASKAFGDLAACMERPDSQLNVLYVLDASSSLEEDTDPQRLRGKLLAQSLEQLGSLAAEREVYYAVSSFDLGYAERKPWSQLTPENAADAAAWSQNQYGWWGTGQATDWLSALDGGLATMQQSPNAKASCKMMVWVTDGGINVNSDKRDFAANIAAMEEICGTNPITGVATGQPAVVDAIRSSGIHLVAVALASQAFLDTLPASGRADEESKFSYLVPVSEGSGTVSNAGLTGDAGTSLTYECGTSPVPQDWAAGAFVLGSSPIALAFQLGGVVDRIRGGQPLGEDIDVPGTFEVTPGINRVTIQLAGSAWSIVGPDGLTAASSDAPSTDPSVKYTTQGELVSIQIDEPVLRPGTWRIEVTEPKAKARVFIYALLTGSADIPVLRVGEPGDIVITIDSEITGRTVNRADYEAQPISVSAGAPGGQAQTLACTDDPVLLRYTCAYTPTSVGSSMIRARLDVKALNGTSLYTFIGNFSEQVAPQASYPQVLPDQFTLSALDGRRGQATGKVTIKGPEKGSGQVCLPAADEVSITQDVVDRADTYIWGGSGWGTCIPVGQGETATASITVANEVPATGTVSGAFTVQLKSSESNAIVTQQVTFTFDSIRQGTPPPWLVTFLVLFGLAVPILLLYLQARASSRLVMRGLQVASIPVVLAFSGGYATLKRAKPEGGHLLTLEDWTWPSGQGGQRSFPCPGGVTLRAVTPRNPLGPITARAQASTGIRVASARGTAQDGAWAPIDLNPAGEWFVSAAIGDLADPSKAEINGTLVAFVNPGMGDLGERSREMSSDIQSAFQPQTWSEIRDAASRAGAKGSSRQSAKASRKDSVADDSWDNASAPASNDPWSTPSPATPASPARASLAPPAPSAPAPSSPAPPASPPATPGAINPDDLWK